MRCMRLVFTDSRKTKKGATPTEIHAHALSRWYTHFSESVAFLGRRYFLKQTALRGSSASVFGILEPLIAATEGACKGGGGLDVHLSRFLMKRDYPRFEVKTSLTGLSGMAVGWDSDSAPFPSVLMNAFRR